MRMSAITSAGNDPLQRSQEPGRRRQGFQFLQIHLRMPVLLDSRDVAGAHHGQDPSPGRGPDLVGQIAIALVDQGAPKLGQAFAHLGEQGVEHVAFFQLFNVGFFDLVRLSQGHDQLAQQLHLAPEAHQAPGAGQGHPDVPVGQMHGGPHFGGSLDGAQHFLPRPDPQLVPDSFLEGSQQQVGKQQEGLFLPDHLEQIGFLPALLLGQGLVAGGTELYAHRLRFFLTDNAADELGAFPGHVGRPQQGDLLVLIDEPKAVVVVSHGWPSYNGRRPFRRSRRACRVRGKDSPITQT